MSALPVGQPFVVVENPYRVVRGEAQSAPRSQDRARVHAQVSMGAVLARVALFMMIVWMGYLAAGMAGHVLLEKARNQAIEAERRSVAALKLAASEQARVDALLDLREVMRWSSANGFIAPDRLVDPSTHSDLVASHGSQL